MRTMLYFMICMLLLGACSNSGGETEQSDDADLAAGSTAQQNEREMPIYLSENEYKGDEREIVRQLNRLMKALYTHDVEEYNKVFASTDDNKKPVLSINYLQYKSLEFDAVPDFEIPEHAKTVVVEFVEKRIDTGEIEEEKQLFIFEKEDGEWKLQSRSDWW